MASWDGSRFAQPSAEKINCHSRSDDNCNDDCADYRWGANLLPGQPKIVMSGISEHRSGHGRCKASDCDHRSGRVYLALIHSLPPVSTRLTDRAIRSLRPLNRQFGDGAVADQNDLLRDNGGSSGLSRRHLRIRCGVQSYLVFHDRLQRLRKPSSSSDPGLASCRVAPTHRLPS
jgi:hypothetical protein